MAFISNAPDTPTDTGQAGVGIGSIIGVLLGLLGNLFSNGGVPENIKQAIDQATDFDHYNTILGESFLAGALNAIAQALLKWLAAIAGALGKIVSDIIHGRLAKLLADLIALIKAILGPIQRLIAWLQALQKLQRQYMLQWMRTYIDIVQRIRAILVPLRLLHVAWATKLDGDLAASESDLGSKIAKIIAHDNEVRSLLDTILDPTLLLRPGQHLAGVGTMIGAIHRAIGALTPGQLLCAVAPVAPAPLLEPWAQTSTRIMGEIQTNSGDYAIQRNLRDQTLQQYSFDLGVPSIG